MTFVSQNFRQQFANADFVVDDEDVSHDHDQGNLHKLEHASLR